MKILVSAATALLVSMPVFGQQQGPTAQEQEHRPGAHMMARCSEKMGGPMPAMLLAHRSEFGLTDEQVRQLEVLQAQMKSGKARQHAGSTPQARAAHQGQHKHDGSRSMDSGMHDRMKAQHAALAAQAAAILTDEQRARLDGLVQEAARHDHGVAAGHHRKGEARARMSSCPMHSEPGHGKAGGTPDNHRH
jgi:hypothetical protein